MNINSNTTNARQGCEIFFLGVGINTDGDGGTQSGDIIIVTMGHLLSENRDDYKIIVIDSAFKDDAKTTKKHLEDINAVNQEGKIQIDLMISTHPDQDHISGLIELAEDDEIEIKKLWIHDCNKVAVHSTNSIDQGKDLISIANKKGIPMEEPFTGLEYNVDGINARIEVLGPTEEYYTELMKCKNVSIIKTMIKKATSEVSDYTLSVLEDIFDKEFLMDPSSDSNTNSNNASTILMLEFFGAEGNGPKCLSLFTADTGIKSLEKILPSLRDKGWYEEDNRRFIQVPHHGSRRNIGPTILNEILGEKEFKCKRGTCFVSANKKDDRHPKIQVMNAFVRRGYKDFHTENGSKSHGMGQLRPIRNWHPTTEIDLCIGEEEENRS